MKRETLTDQVVQFVRDNPGATVRDIRRAFEDDDSARACLPALAKSGKLRRELCTDCKAIWRYYAPAP